MEDIIAYLKESIQDEFFSKAEKKTLRSIIGNRVLGEHQLNVLRSKIYELANERVTEQNYKFILEWVKAANSTLLLPSVGTSSDAFFSPGEACRTTIINQINGAVSQLQICVFTISDDAIADAILTAHRKGREIRIITDNDKSLDEGSDVERLAREGIAVKMDTTPNHMHHKFMVADGRALITGSYNWTRSAARFNHENVLVTQDAGVIRSFQKEFELLWRDLEAYH